MQRLQTRSQAKCLKMDLMAGPFNRFMPIFSREILAERLAPPQMRQLLRLQPISQKLRLKTPKFS